MRHFDEPELPDEDRFNEGRRRPSLIAALNPEATAYWIVSQRGAPAPLPHCGLPSAFLIHEWDRPTRGAGAPPSLRLAEGVCVLLPAGANEGRRRPSLIAAILCNNVFPSFSATTDDRPRSRPRSSPVGLDGLLWFGHDRRYHYNYHHGRSPYYYHHDRADNDHQDGRHHYYHHHYRADNDHQDGRHHYNDYRSDNYYHYPPSGKELRDHRGSSAR